MVSCKLRSIGPMLAVALWAATAAAETTARVTSEQARVYASDFSSVVATVPGGTVLDVVSRSDDWYEVTVTVGGRIVTGFVYAPNVETGAGVGTPVAKPKWTRRTEAATGTGNTDGAALPGHRLHLLGFGQFGYTRMAAAQTFNALFGSAGSAAIGAGAEVRLGQFFLNASIDRMKKTGHRVFVADDGTVFSLGTSDVVTLTPIAITGGWRFEHEHLTPYIGAGISRLAYREAAEFSDAGEDVTMTITGYQLAGGLEVRDGWVATAFEVGYSRVPEPGGFTGAAAAFHEANMGGLAGRVKVLVGR